MKKRCVDYVNCLIGTEGSGHAIAGPQWPHGMMKLNPDTDRLPCAGYDYSDRKILGFSHTHTEGAGASGGRGNILLTASHGAIKTDESEYASTYSHERERVDVGRYEVHLDDCDTSVRLACTKRVGIHQYVFGKKAVNPYLIVDIGHTLGAKHNCNRMHIQVAEDGSLIGSGQYPIIPGKPDSFYNLYFQIQFNRPIVSHGLWNQDGFYEQQSSIRGRIGGGVFFFGEHRDVCAKVAISYIDIKHAKTHMLREIPEWDFDQVVADTQHAWEQVLSHIRVDTEDEDKKIIFYSGLYRALNQPTDYEENGSYLDKFGANASVPSGGRSFYLDDWAVWDTFRTTHPLQTIVDEETRDDMIASFLDIYDQGGWLPICTAPNRGYHPEMIGHNAVSVIADAVIKGFTRFDRQKAFKAAKKTATEYDPMLHRVGTPPEYLQLGYIPGGADCADDAFSVSITMEFAYADWCTAQLARHTGHEDEYEYFMKRAQNWENVFDPACGFVRRKNAKGEWIEPFDPSDAFKNGFCECTSWEYTFFVPHDTEGLIRAIGGKEAFIQKLDDFFEGEYFNYLNETSLQVPYLYVYANAAWKTQKTIRTYMDTIYANRPDGLWGEDDAGAMSAWMVFGMMGFYPVCPGSGEYVLGSPSFDRLSIRMKNGNAFTVEAVDNSKQNVYIKEAFWNDTPYDKCFVTHEMIKSGGTLRLVMSDTPNTELFSKSVPYSMTSHDKKPPDVQAMDLIRPTLRFYHHDMASIKRADHAPLCDTFAEHHTADACAFGDERRLIIYAKGNMSRSEYGLVYRTEPIEGDFTVSVTIESVDLSSPYAPAGIIISDSITDLDMYGHHVHDVTAGAMAKRGYYLYTYHKNDPYPSGYRYAVDCPKQGCTILVEKRDHTYTAYYLEPTMQSMKRINRVIVPDESRLRTVGLYQGSNSPDRRCVTFSNFMIQRHD